MLLFWVVIIIAVIWLVAGILPRMHHGDTSVGRSDDPMEILKMRYASGEIDKAEFEAKRRDLSR